MSVEQRPSDSAKGPIFAALFTRHRAGLALGAVFALALCLAAPAAAQERVEVSSPEELLAFFEKLNYTPQAWEQGIRDVPRVYLMAVGKNWRVSSQNIEVIHKKRIFFRALGPLVLRANEKILEDRERLRMLIETNEIDSDAAAWLRELAQRYKVDGDLDDVALAKLLERVDAVPVSLVLAQGAEESGWGTSRFAAEGNALFGQWTWGGKGIKPKEQREGLGDYRIAAFDTPLESVEAYLLNINSNDAYKDLRERRAAMRVKQEDLSGWELAESLTSYSERGHEYVESLHAIMRVNKLQPADEAVLVGTQEWLVYPVMK
ncbi:glucosaminidase domain-containing protein [Pelagibius marinus]|uniref:glucosaminidase domain-containing protein n=1 Tax=Pelagibius marinus TaxID=2762760 RepID=UPI0018726CAF|nr:glucosaminidase domain-containing protein [Pelagibius marinus]